MTKTRHWFVLGAALWVGGCSFLSWDDLGPGGRTDAPIDGSIVDSTALDARQDGPSDANKDVPGDANTPLDAFADVQTDARDAALSDARVDTGSPLDAAAQYAREVLLDSPIAYFRFDEPLGATTLANSAPGGINKVSIESAYAVVNGGIYGRAFALTDASKNQSARFALNLPVSGNQAVTVEGWFNLPAINPGDGGPLLFLGSKLVTSYGNYSGGLSIGTKREAPAGIFTGTEFGSLANTINVYIAIVYDGTDLIQYFDGIEVGRAPSRSAWDSGALTPLALSFFVNGTSVDELAVYNKALTSSRIGVHATAGSMR
jgi:hypothetical protein